MTDQPTRDDFDSTDGLKLAVHRWDPAGEPRAIAQIAHGLGEHALRYSAVAEALTARGFVVYAHDHRGHGATSTSPAAYGVLGESGWGELVADIGRVGRHARAAHPDLMLVLIAHSMGSFAAQQFLLDPQADVDAVVLTGTAAIDLLEPALDLEVPTDLTIFNAAFQPARTDFDWLSRDEAQVDRYVADPRCGFGLDVAGGKAMFVGARRMADIDQVAAMPADLPIRLIVGELDPVNGQLALAHAVVERYQAAGLTDVSLQVYPKARHEVFNEINSEQVVAEMIDWIDDHLTA